MDSSSLKVWNYLNTSQLHKEVCLGFDWGFWIANSFKPTAKNLPMTTTKIIYLYIFLWPWVAKDKQMVGVEKFSSQCDA